MSNAFQGGELTFFIGSLACCVRCKYDMSMFYPISTQHGRMFLLEKIALHLCCKGDLQKDSGRSLKLQLKFEFAFSTYYLSI